MANEMTSTALASIINSETIVEARLAFQKNANLPGVCRFADLTGLATKVASFPVFVSATVTTPGSETTDVTTNSDITPTDVTLTVARRTIKILPSDLGWASSQENMSAVLGQIIGAARAKKVDQDIAAVMTTNFTSSVGATNSTAMTQLLIQSALLTLETNEANDNLILALHPKQWALLRDDFVLVSASTAGAGANGVNTDRSAQGQEVLNSGLVTLPLYGAQVIVTPRIGTGTDTNDIYCGFMGNCKESIGYALKNVNADMGLPEIELERDASIGGTEVVMNYYDKAGIIRASGLVLVKSQTY